MRNSGSDWLSCDLHIHTPKSVIQGYGGDTINNWEKYICDLEALPETFKVIGINDYLFVDGYEKVIEYKRLGRLSNIELILPVVELRLSIFAGQSDLNKINYHIIFADDAELPLNDIKDQFLNRLIVKKRFDSKNHWDKCVSTKDMLAEYGVLCKSQTPKEKLGNLSDVEFGFNNLTYDINDVQELLKSSNFYSRGKKLYFTAIGRAEWEKMRWDSAMADKKSIINGVDFVFTASQSVAHYERGKASLKSNDVNANLLHFSDAHYLSGDSTASTMKIGDSYTYIKCRPTFEGIRQIKHVFEQRVRVSESAIESKKPYYIIESVRFNDNTGKNIFQPDPICLNQNLNTIIGGKSTGKSLLLNHIAKSIDYDEVSRRLSSVTTYEHEKLPDFDFTVTWKDGAEDTLTDSKETNRKIVYISQSYIDELTSSKFDERVKFNEFVLDILLQDERANELYKNFQQEVALQLSKINSGIQRIFDLKSEVKRKDYEIAEIGDILGVTNYIASLSKDIEELKSDGMSDDESAAYSKLMKDTAAIRSEVDRLDKDRSRLRKFVTVALTNFNEIEAEYDTLIKVVQDERVKTDIKELLFNPKGMIQSIKENQWRSVERIKNYIESATNNLANYDAQLSPLASKSKQALLLKQKVKLMAEEQDKLVQIHSEAEILTNLKEKLNDTIISALDDYNQIGLLYLTCANDLKQFSDVSDELDISIQVRFNNQNFNSQVESNRANKPSLKRLFPNMTSEDDAYQYRYEKSGHSDDQKKFLKAIVGDSLKLNQHGNPKQLAKAVFEDNYFLNFVITYQHDTLDAMSPGKKNLVVLKLLIELNNSEYPILIDQPEDDLDNRSIYDDLVQFILKKKSQRQIILVTHNPNVVVGTDSENTIVANQAGQVMERTNRRYQFEYCNGAIEDSFEDDSAKGILYKKGIKEHICDILEGGEKAFKEREARYSFHRE